jgi:hypothetical protein
MRQHEIDDINRKLAIHAAKYGFAATARQAPRDEAKVVFDAFAWRNGAVLNHTASYLEIELARLGPVAIAMQFIEAAKPILGEQSGRKI